MTLLSLLEYSLESLQNKLHLLDNHVNVVNDLQKSRSLSLHLDFVLPQFAKDRSVMTSLGLCDVFDTLKKQYNNQKLELSIHLMGETEDLLDAYKFFDNHTLNPLWHYLILVPEKYLNSWQKNLKKTRNNIRFGCWYDLNEWQGVNFIQKRTNLLMTVLAGKSGQKLTPEIQQNVLDVTRLHPNTHFILDGGWSIDTISKENTDIVSYSSFWKHIED
jgi:pentose-5-phosphate-3-epimerase